MMELFVAIVVVGLLAYLAYWFVGKVGLPEPFNKAALVIIAVVIFIFLWRILVKFAPSLNI